MPRNEFMNHDEDNDFTLEIVRDEDGNPIDIVKVPNHPGKGEVEAQGQEVATPVEEDPHMWPDATRPTLAELRKGPGATTTQAHIAELYEDRDAPLS